MPDFSTTVDDEPQTLDGLGRYQLDDALLQRLLLDPAAPVSQEPRQKDSGQLKFAGGNPWVEVGSWQRTMP